MRFVLFRPLPLAIASITGALCAVVACGTATPRLVAPGPGLDAFVAMDQDHDGELAADEFTSGLGGTLPAREVSGIFNGLDQDHDGKLSLAEYFPDPALTSARR
jgi:hypothetical protein